VLLGGTTPKYGIFDFEAFSFNIQKRLWQKIAIKDASAQMIGT